VSATAKQTRPVAVARGNWSQVCSSSILPFFFLLTPPHCLKKNGTFAARHWSLISAAHSGFIGLAPGPDSPPTMTQSIPEKSILGIGLRSGSKEINLIAASVCLKWSIRYRYLAVSTVTPIHILGCQGNLEFNSTMRLERLVKIWYL